MAAWGELSKAEQFKRVMESPAGQCSQCGAPMDLESVLCSGICGRCVRANHRRVAGKLRDARRSTLRAAKWER